MKRSCVILPLLIGSACGIAETVPAVSVAEDIDLVTVDYPITVYTSWHGRGSKSTFGATDPHAATVRCVLNTCDISEAVDQTLDHERKKLTIRPREVSPFQIVVTLENLDTGEIYEETLDSEAVIPNDLVLTMLPVIDGSVRMIPDEAPIELAPGTEEIEAEIRLSARYDTRRLPFLSTIALDGVALGPQSCRSGNTEHDCRVTVRAGTRVVTAEVSGREVMFQREVVTQ